MAGVLGSLCRGLVAASPARRMLLDPMAARALIAFARANYRS